MKPPFSPDRNFLATMLLFCVSAIRSSPDASAQDLSAVRSAAQRGLTFLEVDTRKWRAEHECATCHHGIMTVWAFSEAERRGLPVGPAASSEILDWTKKQFMERMDLPRDSRPGWKMVSTPGICLLLMAQCIPGQTAVTPDELAVIDRHLLRHQEEDGSWAWSSAPPGNRPPPFFESDEVATRMVLTGFEGRDVKDSDKAGDIRTSREKATRWLAQAAPETTTQAAAVRLLMSVHRKSAPEVITTEIRDLLTRCNDDGGWGQLDERPSDAYATGQVLYVLSQAGTSREQPEIQRAIEFLLKSQREDGSWPMSSRSHPGAEPFTNPVPITCFGSAWGTLGLLASLPESPPHD